MKKGRAHLKTAYLWSQHNKCATACKNRCVAEIDGGVSMLCVGVCLCGFGMHTRACLMHEHVCVTCLRAWEMEALSYLRVLLSLRKENVSVGICLDVCIYAHKTSGTVQVGTNKAKSQGYRYPWMLQYFLYVYLLRLQLTPTILFSLGWVIGCGFSSKLLNFLTWSMITW